MMAYKMYLNDVDKDYENLKKNMKKNDRIINEELLDRCYQLAKKYLPKGTSGVISFGVKGGRKAAESFMQKLHLCTIETHVADSRTCCLHPASTTHRQMNEEELLAAGISGDLVRLSCGLEDKEDLIADLKQALESL